MYPTTSFVEMHRPMTSNIGRFSVQIPRLNRGKNATKACIVLRNSGVSNESNNHLNPNSPAWTDAVFGVHQPFGITARDSVDEL